MIVTKTLQYGYVILGFRNKYEIVREVRALAFRNAKKNYKRMHRVTAAFGALSHLEEISNDHIRDMVLMQDRYCLTFKYKMNTTSLLLKLDKLVEYIECKIISIKSKLFTLH